jgi:hypothetical protein
VLHTLVGVFLFSLVGGAAMIVNYFTVYIERSGVSPYILCGVQGLEFFLFAADFICMIVFIVKEVLIFIGDTVGRRERVAA